MLSAEATSRWRGNKKIESYEELLQIGLQTGYSKRRFLLEAIYSINDHLCTVALKWLISWRQSFVIRAVIHVTILIQVSGHTSSVAVPQTLSMRNVENLLEILSDFWSIKWCVLIIDLNCLWLEM